MGLVGSNGKDNGRSTHWFLVPNHGETGAEEPVQDVGDTGVRGRAGSSVDEVGGHINWPQEGECGPVGSAASYL